MSLGNRRWDVVVIGGGPAGMMAAGRAAEKGASVLLVEKNPILGKKLLITGGGRCNILNAEFETRLLLEKYGEAGKYLASPYASFDAKDAYEFFEGRGLPLKVENEKRTFPVTENAQTVRDTLVGYMEDGNVQMEMRSPVASFVTEQGAIASARLKDGTFVDGRAFVLSTGGKSRPETGSTGDGFKWLSELGHTIRTADAALVPISVHDAWVKRAAGVSLPDAKLTMFQYEKKLKSFRGKVLITHDGLSGPAVLNASREIGEFLQYGDVVIDLDIQPNLGYEKVNSLLQKIFKENDVKKLKNSLKELAPSALVPILLQLSLIDGEKTCNAVTREERVRLMKLVKHIPVSVKGLLGLDKAVVTSGGVILDEVDTRFMRSRLIRNLYLAGDILDVNRPSGGYSLQLAWTTGRIAGEYAYTAHENV